jgi:hypothetical protein
VQLGGCCVTIHDGHLHIDQNQIERLRRSQIDGDLTVRGANGVPAGVGQLHAQ